MTASIVTTHATTGPPVTEGDTTAPDGATVLTFADGIPGFAHLRRFVLEDLTSEGTFQLLLAVDDPEVSIVVTSPWLFFPEYAPELPRGDQDVLGIETPEDVVVFCTAIADDTEQLHLNLRAPFVVNARSLAARQVILDEDLPLRATIGADDAGTGG
ncbi:hypothetical protein FTX61_18355 [Nitriliruptoraceae bacterium ZYF776]|nr:hypothetical protein [Profundirhabdus halotolerans]